MSNVVAMREGERRPDGHPVELVTHGVMIALTRTLAMFDRDRLEDVAAMILPPAWEDLSSELGFESRLLADVAKIVLEGGRGVVLGVCSDLQIAKSVLEADTTHPPALCFLAERMLAANALVQRFEGAESEENEQAPSDTSGPQQALGRIRRLVRLALKDPVAALAISQDPRLETWGWLQSFARAVTNTDAADPSQYFAPQLRQTVERWISEPKAAAEFLETFENEASAEGIPHFLFAMARVFSIAAPERAGAMDAMVHLEMDEY